MFTDDVKFFDIIAFRNSLKPVWQQCPWPLLYTVLRNISLWILFYFLQNYLNPNLASCRVVQASELQVSSLPTKTLAKEACTQTSSLSIKGKLHTKTSTWNKKQEETFPYLESFARLVDGAKAFEVAELAFISTPLVLPTLQTPSRLKSEVESSAISELKRSRTIALFIRLLGTVSTEHIHVPFILLPCN